MRTPFSPFGNESPIYIIRPISNTSNTRLATVSPKSSTGVYVQEVCQCLLEFFVFKLKWSSILSYVIKFSEVTILVNYVVKIPKCWPLTSPVLSDSIVSNVGLSVYWNISILLRDVEKEVQLARDEGCIHLYPEWVCTLGLGFNQRLMFRFYRVKSKRRHF